MIRRSLILVAALSLGFAPAPVYRPKPETMPDHWKILVGTWESDPPVKGDTVEISPGRMTYNQTRAYALTLNPDARPAGYDIKGMAGPAAGAAFTGIYKVEGDTLTLCYNTVTERRPVAFGQGITEVYKRKKR